MEAEIRRQLPQNRTELLAQVGHTRGQEVREGELDASELQHVGDIARAFDREHEVLLRLATPARVVLGTLQGMERAVDLERIEHARRVLELAPARQALGIETAAPGRVAPPGKADADFTCAGVGRADILIRSNARFRRPWR